MNHIVTFEKLTANYLEEKENLYDEIVRKINSISEFGKYLYKNIDEDESLALKDQISSFIRNFFNFKSKSDISLWVSRDRLPERVRSLDLTPSKLFMLDDIYAISKSERHSEDDIRHCKDLLIDLLDDGIINRISNIKLAYKLMYKNNDNTLKPIYNFTCDVSTMKQKPFQNALKRLEYYDMSVLNIEGREYNMNGEKVLSMKIKIQKN